MMKPMSECKGFNMDRLLLKYNNGLMRTGYYKDGMIQLDGSHKWYRIYEFESFILLKDLDELLNK